jgi:8-oxo-dGTP pyrophosphatase MutT (NUDIX family)
MSGLSVVPVDRLDLAFAPWCWAFAKARRAEIEAHFAERRRRTPEIWNGRVLMMSRCELKGRTLSGSFFETSFAEFIAWRDWGAPDASVVNCFAMGALRAADGAYLLGVMAPHTSAAGRIYFPAGTPDLDDVSDGRVDLDANVMREVAEETGLGPADFVAAPGWHAVRSGSRISLMKVMQAKEPADTLRARILGYLAAEAQPELCDIRIVRSPADLVPQMPEFVGAFLAHAWEGRM